MPTHLLNDCVRVDLAILSTNGDMARALLEQDKALQDCTEDKRAIRALQPSEASGSDLPGQPSGEK